MTEGTQEYKDWYIDICEQVLDQYVEKRHDCDLYSCTLCVTFYMSDGMRNNGSCGKCINKLFGNIDVGCRDRLCEPMDSSNINSSPHKEARVTAFWENTIEWLKAIPAVNFVDVGVNPRFNNIKAIDKETYNEFEK